MLIHSRSARAVPGLLIIAALAAAAMYLFDPDKGRRRRALAGDKLRSFGADATDRLGTAARDVKFRAQGAKAKVLRPFRREGVPDDLVLIERVRATLGRLVSHPHAIQVGARAGRVVLSGPVLASEADGLVRSVRSVWGVSEVEDHLVVHQRADAVPSLQGGVPRRKGRMGFLHSHWTPALRVGALVSGGLMAIEGMRHRSLAGCALTGLGTSLVVRAAMNRSMRDLVANYRERHGRAADLPTPIDAAAHLEAVPTAQG